MHPAGRTDDRELKEEPSAPGSRTPQAETDQEETMDFEEIYRTYLQDVYRFLLKLCHDEQIAEELT